MNYLLSVSQYNLLEKQIDKEWLKPSKLKQVGGVSARDKISNQLR